MGECAFFNEERKIYIEKLEASPILSDQHIQSIPNPEFLTQLILNLTVIPDLEECDSDGLGSLELCTREYIHKIHVRRIVALKRISKILYTTTACVKVKRAHVHTNIHQLLT